jgi:hypothetical protein
MCDLNTVPRHVEYLDRKNRPSKMYDFSNNLINEIFYEYNKNVQEMFCKLPYCTEYFQAFNNSDIHSLHAKKGFKERQSKSMEL